MDFMDYLIGIMFILGIILSVGSFLYWLIVYLITCSILTKIAVMGILLCLTSISIAGARGD